MNIIRPIQAEDIEGLYALAKMVGSGLTTLPADETVLKSKINSSIKSFKTDVETPGDEYYLFVMQCTKTDKIIGCSAIDAVLGLNRPYYFYKLSHHTMQSEELNIKKKISFLSMVNDYEGNSELCTLYLSPQYRRQHNGKLLSLSRLLYMANEPHRFADKVIAELRGISDKSGYSPFWQAVGKHFFDMDFAQAVYMLGSGNKQFVHDLMPTIPICTELLPKSAQEVIGIAHQNTVPAKKMLEKEGFCFQGYVDLFDAGPCLEASKQQLNTVRESQLFSIDSIQTIKPQNYYLISNVHKSFRACIASISVVGNSNVILSPELAETLMVEVGDFIRLAKIRN